MKRKFWIFAVLLSIVSADLLWAQQEVFTKVKVRFNRSEKDPRLIDKDVDLVFDDTARKLIVKSIEQPLDITYNDVDRVIFDVSSHMRGGAMSQVVGGLVGAAIAAKHVNDYWCYLEYKKPDGKIQPYLMEIDKESSEKVIEKMKRLFGDKVTVADFPEKEAKIEKSTLKDLQSKHDIKVDKKSRPVPEIKADKALMVVVCPALAARYAGKGNQFKIHADDQVVAVNRMGTYSYFYLDPGEYLLVSQTENASGFKIKVEAGQGYYFFQNTFMGTWKAHTTLSRQTRELVMHELSGTYYANWKRKG